MKRYVVIVAGGSGRRMGDEIPKQFIDICNKPVIVHAINAFIQAYNDIEIVIVINSKVLPLWENICKRFPLLKEFHRAEGGPERFHSVKNGLTKISDNNAVIAIHDAVRPFISLDVIKNAFKEAALFGNAVPVVNINDSVRIKNGPLNEPIDRKKLFIVQTPQCFQSGLIKKAYQQNYDDRFTDDAMVLESTGERIRLIEGNLENIKITRSSDLIIAEAFFKNGIPNADVI